MTSFCGKCQSAVSVKPKKKRFYLAPNGKVYAKCGRCGSLNKLDEVNNKEENG